MIHHKSFQIYSPINEKPPTLFSFALHLQWGNQPKIRFGHNFWLGGPIDTRSIRLNCILQDLFRDTPLDHNWHTQISAQIRPNTVFGAAKYGQVGCPWKDFAKCSSDATPHCWRTSENSLANLAKIYNSNIAKGTTDPRVEFLSQVQSCPVGMSPDVL